MVLVDVMVMCRRRNLSDINNRGKLNLPEFHVAMGLIYRGTFRLTEKTVRSKHFEANLV
jgi:hypothetical protein